MGRRSINTTKSGKYMNPTDQARKEARKKELKKNKKQRQLVRAAVLKGKDPAQIIEEMEKIDQMEYNVMQPPPLNEKVLKDKRKKLKETLDRVLKMYAKDDQEKWIELKEHLVHYERRKIDLVSYFEAVRHAQQVQVDEIPLPSPNTDMIGIYPGSLPSHIPLPEISQPCSHTYPDHTQYMIQSHPLMAVPPSILKKKSSFCGRFIDSTLKLNKEPPGVPPFVPPNFSSDTIKFLEKVSEPPQKLRTIRFSDNKKDSEVNCEKNEKNIIKNQDKEREIETVKPTSVQQKMLAMAGQDIDEFMRDMESAHKKKINERAQDLNTRLSLINATPVESCQELGSDHVSDTENIGVSDTREHSSSSLRQQKSSMHMLHQHHRHHGMPSMSMPPPTTLIFRPPPPPMHLRLPPPPPRIGLRLPPGPPPGMPRMLRPGPPSMPRMPPPAQIPITSLQSIQSSQLQNSSGSNLQIKTPNVLSAAPQLISRKEDNKTTTTIEAKPQIRNLAADVTRFLPTSLRVKREDRKKISSTLRLPEHLLEIVPPRLSQPKTKDDAYMQFMQEMKGLL